MLMDIFLLEVRTISFPESCATCSAVSGNCVYLKVANLFKQKDYAKQFSARAEQVVPG